ncbi:hypothetical protein NDU88_002722 [Pleurodeles waltl]|uniref:Uncharacterized protein n=1 Tax=Pleurodeles waltl TaxID=8319 RepID=A0AAV7SBB3_PLEWA|nr:hypothetical protein NDU88_002722 [Pleurodeles waltl]
MAANCRAAFDLELRNSERLPPIQKQTQAKKGRRPRAQQRVGPRRRRNEGDCHYKSSGELAGTADCRRGWADAPVSKDRRTLRSTLTKPQLRRSFSSKIAPRRTDNHNPLILRRKTAHGTMTPQQRRLRWHSLHPPLDTWALETTQRTVPSEVPQAH